MARRSRGAAGIVTLGATALALEALVALAFAPTLAARVGRELPAWRTAAQVTERALSRAALAAGSHSLDAVQRVALGGPLRPGARVLARDGSCPLGRRCPHTARALRVRECRAIERAERTALRRAETIAIRRALTTAIRRPLVVVIPGLPGSSPLIVLGRS